MHERIFGIVPPMTTPFRPDDTLDEDALRAETRYLVDTARVHGLAVGGSTGEGHAMTGDEVRRATAIVVEAARGRVPVITGIITDSTASAIERGRAVRDLGVTALQVTPVHYLFRPDDDAMLRALRGARPRDGSAHPDLQRRPLDLSLAPAPRPDPDVRRRGGRRQAERR